MSINDRVSLQPTNRYQRATGPDLSALFGSGPKPGAMSWADADASLLAAAISHWTSGGHAITFGVTSDGGALSISLLSGGKPYKLYASDPDELASLLERIGGVPLA